MPWHKLTPSSCQSHHVNQDQHPAYNVRFDGVLKFHAPGLAPVSSGGLAWHIQTNGSPAYKRRFKQTFGFYEGLAAIADENGWHHINTSGEEIYPERYDWCGNFQGGRCTVRTLNAEYLHIDTKGIPLYPKRWRYVGDYRDDFAVVQADDGRSTHIDHHGGLIHSQWFLDLDVFHKGFARARDAGGWMHIDRSGSPTHTRRFSMVEPFYNGQARIERLDGGLEVIDEDGRTLRELRPARQSEFTCLSGDMVGFWRTQTIGAAVKLGVPDVLPATTDEVAARCKLTEDNARRLLRALGELSLLERDGKCWNLTARGVFLRRDHPMTLADAALEYAGPLSKMWNALPQALSAPSTWSPPDIFEQVAADDARREGHHRMLQSYAQHDYPLVVEALELQDTDKIVDAGGGLGTLAGMIAKTHPSLSVTVLDRPEVVEIGARETTSSELRWHPADFFEPWGIEANVVLLSRILHDWNDDDALKILTRARQILSPGGRVFIIEMLTSEENVAGALCDLHLLTVTGGRERSAAHYEQLLTESGFKPAGVRRLAALPSIVVGVVS